VTGTVSHSYLSQTVVDSKQAAIRAGGHIAIGECLGQRARGTGELPEQDTAQTALLCFGDRAGVMCDQSTQHLVGVLHVAQVTGSVERMESGVDQVGGVADVVEPGSGFEQIGILAQDRYKSAGLRGNALAVCPAARQWDLKELAGDLFGPIGFVHDPDVK
jgi:hypothetical protein